MAISGLSHEKVVIFHNYVSDYQRVALVARFCQQRILHAFSIVVSSYFAMKPSFRYVLWRTGEIVAEFSGALKCLILMLQGEWRHDH